MVTRVRERLVASGPGTLSSGELLAAVLGNGAGSYALAATILLTKGSLPELARADVIELIDVPGLGRARAAQIAAAFELGRRATAPPSTSRWTVRSPRDVVDQLGPQLARLEREELHVVLLNTKNAVLRHVPVYLGNVSSAVVRVGELFRDAVRVHAAGLIVVHNHPSGDPEPSPDDMHLTSEAIAAGRLLDVPVLDHVVIAADGFVSLRDRGLAFDRPGR